MRGEQRAAQIFFFLTECIKSIDYVLFLIKLIIRKSRTIIVQHMNKIEQKYKIKRFIYP
jgi:hypothetical protein